MSDPVRALGELTHMQIVMLWGHRSDGPSTQEIVSFARSVIAADREARAALAQPAERVAGWRFKRNADGSIGIHAPPPKPGESRRTSAVVYASTDRDLHELLGKFIDHLSTGGGK